MANDNRRSHRVKSNEINKSKKKMVTQYASPETSSSRRSSRETSSSKQTKEIPSSTRKSKRLEMSKPSDSHPNTRQLKRNQEQMTTTPMKRYDRRNKHTYVDSSGTKKRVEEPAASSIKSKNEKVKRSLKMDSREDKKQEKQGLDGGGRKRKRVTSSVDKALSRSLRKRTEADHDSDKESQDGSSQAASSSNRDVENSKNTDSGSESVEDKGDDDVEECSDRTGEESTLKASQTQCSTSNSSLTNFSVEEINDPVEVEESPDSKKVEGVTHDAVQELSNDIFVDLEQVEHVGSLSKKSLHGGSIENGSVTPISGKGASSKRETPTQKTDPDVCTDIKEFWVPVQISNVQLEQYCSMLLTNAMALSSCSKSDTVGALHDILTSNRKCCDHPYIVDQSLQGALTKDLEPAKFLEVGIKASGKLQFLDVILPEMRKRKLRVLILFQPLSGTGKDSTSIGDILDDFVRQRFGEDSYERVDAIITNPSKRQAALNNFNNKEMGRFIFLLDHRACQSSIKLSSVDTIIIFDSDWNPANDLRALQKITIDSQPEKVKIFRLYTSWTLEEKILKLSEHNITIDRGLQNLSRSTCDALLIWGATYLFSKLTEFHRANILPEEGLWNELMEEFFNLISDKHYTAKLIITRVEQSCENLPLPNELRDGEQPHMFWRKLLAGRDPCWKYLTTSTPRQRKRPQFYDSLEKPIAISDDVGRKRKKTAPVSEKGEIKEACTVISSDGSQLSPGDSISCAATCNETSFRHLLKLNISELCRVLKLSEEVKKMVESFLEYVIENYQVNKEPANTLQAFLISLCWIGSALLKKKLDRKQTLAIARKRLNFTCEEEETNSVYLKLEQAKETFLLHRKNQKKTNVSKEINPHVPKVEVPDSPEDQYVTISPDMSDVPEDQNNSPGSNNNSQEKVTPLTQPLVFPPSGQPVPTNSVEIRIESIQDNLLQTKDAEKVDQIITEMPPVEQQHEAPPQVLETTADDPHHTALQHWPDLLNLQESEIYNRRSTRMPSCSDPLQVELEKFSELKNTVNNFYEAIKLKLRSDYEKERSEMLAKINRKYEDRSQKAEVAFKTKKNEIDINFNKVVRNKILAEAFRSKCRDLNPFDHSQIQREMQHLHQFHCQPSPSPSPGQSSGSQQVNKLHPTPQIVHQSTNLFSHTSTRPPPSNPITPSQPPRPPPSNISTTTTPTGPPPNISSSKPPPIISPITPSTTRPPPQMNPSSTPNRTPPHMNPLTTPSKPPPNITSTTPSLRNPNPQVTGEIRAPAPHIRPFKPSTSVSPHDHASHRVMLGQHTSSSLPPSSTTFSHTPAKPPLPPSSQTPTNHNSHATQPPLPPSQMPPTFPPTHNNHPVQQVAPPPPTNHNNHPTQPPLPPSSQMLPSFPTILNSHTTQPVAPPLPPPSQTPTNDNSHPAQPVAPPSIQLPSLHPSEQHPPATLGHNNHPTQPPLPPSSQMPPSFPTILNSHPTRPVAPPLPPPSQTPTNDNSHPAQPVAPSSIQLPSLHPSEQHPPATSSSSLPPMPSVPIHHTGLYSSGGFMNLLMDVDKEAGFHPTDNVLPSQSEVLEPTVFGTCGDGDVVCLSDDD